MPDRILANNIHDRLLLDGGTPEEDSMKMLSAGRREQPAVYDPNKQTVRWESGNVRRYWPRTVQTWWRP